MQTQPLSMALGLFLLVCSSFACSGGPRAPAPDLAPITGSWRATLNGRFHLDMEILADRVQLADGDVDNDVVVIPHRIEFDGGRFSIVFDHSPFMPESVTPPSPGHGNFTMTASVQGDAMTGTGTRADGKAFDWVAARLGR